MGARAKRARPFIVSVPAVASVLAVSVSVVCDQVDQVVPAHQVDDINEVHELDPVHQVDHKDEYTVPHITSHHITSHHITSHCDDIGRFLGRHRSFLAVLAVFVVFGSHFPDFCSQNGIFYKQLVASGNSPGIRPAFPAFPVIPVKWGRRVRRGPSLPHAPGARMTVVHTNSLKLNLLQDDA